MRFWVEKWNWSRYRFKSSRSQNPKTRKEGVHPRKGWTLRKGCTQGRGTPIPSDFCGFWGFAFFICESLVCCSVHHWLVLKDKSALPSVAWLHVVVSHPVVVISLWLSENIRSLLHRNDSSKKWDLRIHQETFKCSRTLLEPFVSAGNYRLTFCSC